MILMSSGTIIAIAVVAVVLILIIAIIGWFISTRNRFVRMNEDIDNSESRIDVYLTKRFDDLTKMVSTVKGYAKHESESLTNIVAMRNPGAKASMKEKAEFSEQLTNATRQLNLVVEQYPNLKADGLFIRLQNEISEIEENLQAARSNYNSNVANYNKAIKVFPASIIAGSKFLPREYFEAEESKRKDVEISF